MSAPTGTVSFLFTDVEGSTRLWQSDSDGMGASLALHDEIMREAAGAHSGHVFSTAGDAFAVAFHSTDAALSAALQAQRRLVRANWPGPEVTVRMGVHSGTAEERDGDYFGPTLNRAARIMSAGHGGQVLVSSVAADGAGDVHDLVDLGVFHLKDLQELQHLFELRHSDLPVVTKPIRTVDVRNDNLPDYLTSFVGRSRELAEVETLIADNRMAVLTGVGGTGKTRLAVEVARSQIASFADGAWLVELAPVTKPELVMIEIGDTWGLRPGEGAPIEDVVARYLWEKELLLVVDNCEHLLESATVAIKRILDSCLKVRVVATSRESLGIPGEATLRVPSLGLPDGSQPADQSEAVMLFLDRARSARPDFLPDPDDLEAIGRIVTRIDGIPLGLELAAARLRSISPHELADRLEESFRILSGSAKSALPRQRTLAATIDWSHELLQPAERNLFQRLSVFVGGFSLAAAEAVCGGGGVEKWEVVDHLDSLVDKSLVTIAPEADDHTRYRLLEPVRQYAQERFSETGQVADFHTAHARHYADRVASITDRLRGKDRSRFVEQIENDYDNIRSALTTFHETGDIDRYFALTFDLFSFWMHRGAHVEAVQLGLAGQAAANRATDPQLQIKVWFITAILGAEITSPAAVEHARAGLAFARGLDDPSLIGRMELALGAAIRHATIDPDYLEHLHEARRLLAGHIEPHWWDRDWESAFISFLFSEYLPADDQRRREYFDSARRGFETVGDSAMLGVVLTSSQGFRSSDLSDDNIQANLERASEIFATEESLLWHAHALFYLGIWRHLAGNHSGAIELLTAGSERLEEVGDMNCWAGALRFLAVSESARGAGDVAGQKMVAVIDAVPVLPMKPVIKPRILYAAARVLEARGSHTEAAITLGSAETSGEPIFAPEVLRQRLGEQLGVDEVVRLEDEGAGIEIDGMLSKVRTWLTEG